ncbi:hypothetical protein PYW07_001440 [Mythimna separata]|uniref:Uncharacterized protein n=1 Tax=Mythimna separata TaxID=271217 RepID=A0AAD7YT70_MYTSE|nr:hypothetical protein PYW07_001440 [Mythimna separata]
MDTNTHFSFLQLNQRDITAESRIMQSVQKTSQITRFTAVYLETTFSAIDIHVVLFASTIGGSRRPSLTSVQSSSSSIRSYSARRWEREREQKERRQMSMRLAQLHDKMAAGREVPKHAPTPSPRSPNNSTDGLLPSVCEIRELITNPEQQLQGVDGPCSSSSLY